MRIAIIPARGGSVRIPRKNIKMFHGHPMIWYPIQAALRSSLFDDILVSTDDDEIGQLADDYGAIPIPRNKDWLVKDDGTRGTQEVASDLLVAHPKLVPDQVCVIYPCSPLLLPEYLIDSQEYLYNSDYVMSVQAEPLADAGCFYWGQYKAFIYRQPLIGTSTVIYPLPPERCCDINTPEDWARAEKMYEKMRND